MSKYLNKIADRLHAEQPSHKGLDDADCSPSVSDTPLTDAMAETRIVKGKPREIVDADFARNMERERFTITEIADYIAGWTVGSFDEVQKLGAHVASNALNQLRDGQDGIAAVRLRKLHQENAEL